MPRNVCTIALCLAPLLAAGGAFAQQHERPGMGRQRAVVELPEILVEGVPPAPAAEAPAPASPRTRSPVSLRDDFRRELLGSAYAL